MSAAAPQTSNPPARTAVANVTHGNKVAHGAFWVMVRRVTLVAACVDLAFLFLFLALGSPILAWLNVASIGMYLAANGLLRARRNLPALLLIWFEVLGHAAIGSMLVGWDSGFHYYLLMFIPAIVVSGRRSTTLFLLGLLLSFYLALHFASGHFGVLTPLGGTGLAVVHTINVAIVFAMASYTARFYYNTVRRAERQLIELATRDSLTGLANRRNLLDRAEQEITRAKRSGQPISMILADIDHFKRINDTLGHEVGDRVIVHAAAQLLKACREQDIVARWGGEEFLLVLPETAIHEAGVLAERIRAALVGGTMEHAGQPVPFTLSFGIATMAAGESISDAIARTDRALYRSKAQGRDRVSLEE